jgi:hypothetical protein
MVYAVMFPFIFVETGVVVLPFLPGDSLLFVAGALAARCTFSLPVLAFALVVARLPATPSISRSAARCANTCWTLATSVS